MEIKTMVQITQRFPAVSPKEMKKLRKHAGEAANLMKALAAESRLLILCTLTEGEMAVYELNDRIDLSQSGLSQQLAILRRDGLVSTRREAQVIFYSLAQSNALRVIEVLKDIYCAGSGKKQRGRKA
jgi:ArsR family transcriptional regulator, virulence genes transcriptional regulator